MTAGALAGSPTISRPRLAGRLAEALDRGHAAVIAPAGYGKTTLALEAVAGRPLVAWHVCRRGHRDPIRLLTGLATAVDRAQPGAGGRVLDALTDPGDPLRLAYLLAMEVERLLVDPLVLVVDDGEHLAEAEDACAVLDELLDGAGRLRVLLVARTELPLRSRAVLHMARVGREDLVFDAGDTAALLEARLGRRASDEEVRSLLDRTLGWPLGLGIGSRAAEGADADTLVRRLLGGIDEEARPALLASSVVDEVTAEVARALGITPDVAAAGRPAGLVPRPGLADGSLAWHPLVRDALRAVWRRSTAPEDQAEVLGRAGRALRADGRTLAAVDALLAAGEHAAALDLLLADADRLLRRAPAAVAEALEALPPEHAAEPVALLLRGWLDAVRGHAEAAVGPLGRALARMDAAGRGREAAGARLALCESLYFLGRLDDAIAEAGRLADDTDAPVPHGEVAAGWRALYLAAAGRFDASRARIREVLARDHTPAAEGVVAITRSFLEAPAGRHDVALAALDDAHARLVGRERAAGRPEYLSSQSAFLAADLGRREEAVARADRMVADREPDGLPPFVAALAHGLQAWTRALAGRLDAAEAAHAAAVAAGPPDGWPFAFAMGSRALVAAARGAAPETLEAAAAALRVGERAPDMHFSMLAVELASALLDVGAAPAARELVDRLLDRLPADWTYPRARALALRAAATAAQGGRWTADAEALLRHASGEDLTRVLATDWRHVRPLVWATLDEPAVRAGTAQAAALAAIPPEDLLGYADHPVAAARAATASRLARTGHPRSVEVLERLAADEDPSVGRAARAALEDLRARPVPLRLTLLGGFAATRGGWPIDDRAWKRPTAPRLVRYLLVRGGGPVEEDRVAADLWPEHDGEGARSALRMAASRARQVLDAQRSGPSLLAYRDRAYRLELSEGDEVDAWRYTALARAALAASGPQRRGLLARAEEAWGGEPLPEERFADWARTWREDLQALRRRVLLALAGEHRRAGDEHAVAAMARRILAQDDTDEGAHRLLMTALARDGQRSLALRQYLECRRCLVDGLGLEPDAETAALQQRLLAGAPV